MRHNSTSVGTWMPLAIGDEWIYKFRVDRHPERAQRIIDVQSGIGNVPRALGVLASAQPDEWVRRRRT